MSRLFFGVLGGVLFVGVAVGGDLSLPYVQQDVVYHQSHGVAFVADVFVPKTEANGRGIVVVASGGWSSDRGKIRDLNRAGLFEELCQRGFHVFAVRPGSISRFSAHDMKAHVEAGIRWVKGLAGDYGIDPGQLGLFGASAGGHLSSLVAVTNAAEDPRTGASVAAVGVFFPPTDFLDYGGVAVDPRKSGRFHRILKGLAFRDHEGTLTDDEVRAGARSISPARLVTPQAPPFLVIHGDADPVVPLQQSQSLVAALSQAEVPAELIVKEGGAHPWPTVREEVVVMAEWFQKQLVRP